MSTGILLDDSSPISAPIRQRRPVTLVLNKFIVAIYRMLGFVVLTVILVGLAVFLFTKLFFLFNRSWIAPTLLSATDERIVRLNTEIVQQSTLRDKLRVERTSLEVSLKDAQRRADMGAALMESLTTVALNEARVRRGERRRLRMLSYALEQVKGQVAEATLQFSDVSRRTLEEQYKAGLTTQDRYVSGGLQLGQLAQTNLALAEKASELDARRSQMERDTAALLSAALGSDQDDAHLNVDSLRLRQDFIRVTLDAARARDEIKAHVEALENMDRSVVRYNELLKTLLEAPLLKALSGSITIAFVPYEHLSRAHRGSSVFACRIGMLVCRRVGQVKQILPGEVSVHSPIESNNRRGLMLELILNDGEDAAQDQVLFLNHAPLWL